VSLDARIARLKREFGRSDGIVVATAADFLHGGEPTFARAFDRRGALLLTTRRRVDEPWEAFRDRTMSEAASTPQTACLLIGGLPDDVCGIEEVVGSIPSGSTIVYLSDIIAFFLGSRTS